MRTISLKIPSFAADRNPLRICRTWAIWTAFTPFAQTNRRSLPAKLLLINT
jgi:hypothetical protein